MSETFDTDTIILFDSSSNLDQIKKLTNTQTLIITFDYESHKLLSQNGIKHEISDKYLQETDLIEIQKLSYKFSKWYNEADVFSILEYEGINIGKLFYVEFHYFLVPILKKIFELITINKKYHNVNILASSNLYNISKSIFSTVKALTIKDEQTSFLYDSIKFQLTDSISLNISRNSYLKLKKLSEFAIKKILKNSDQNTKKSILLVEFDPIRYEKLFKLSRNHNLNFILFNRRRPAIWNKKSYSIIQNSKCILVTSSDLITKDMQKSINQNQHLITQRFNEFVRKGNFFKSFFSINNLSFWEIIKPFFTELCNKRISEAIQEIEITKALLQKTKFSSILVWSENGFNEQIVIQLAKKAKIKIILLQHGLYWETTENYESNEFSGIFPLESDKFIVWGKITQQYANNYNFSNKVEVLGSAIYDALFDKKTESSVNIKNSILLATSSPVKNQVPDLTIKTREKYEEAIEIICKTVSNLNKKLVIKLHPFQEQQDITKLVRKFGSQVNIVKKADMVSLIESCDVFLTIDFSTAILEAQILDKPVIIISVKDRLLKQFPPLFNSNSCVVTTIDNFENSLTQMLNDNKYQLQIKTNGRNFVNDYLTNQGTAVEKILAFLEKYE